MGFASAWLEKRALFPAFINETPGFNTGLIIVVPAFNEPQISDLLDSLILCDKPDCGVEVIIVVNAPPDASSESFRNNEECIRKIESWKKNNPICFFRLFSFSIIEPSLPGWGVGLARKTGMDEAVRRFNDIDRTDGVIVSLDADCLVEKNYLTSLDAELFKKPNRYACSIYFEHLLGKVGSGILYPYIIWYELHLRFFLQGIKYAGFPYAFHTVGSAIAVKAILYVKAGGMNRRQAGEDFYFIQKLVPSGGYFALNSTTVYPSPRASSRVPFGTGATISKLTTDNSIALLSYNVGAFNDLYLLFSLVDSCYLSDDQDIGDIYSRLPDSIKLFIGINEWKEKVVELKMNTSGEQSFKKRFFCWFNMFKIVKYLNLAHQKHFEKIGITESAGDLLNKLGLNFHSEDPLELLSFYRALEKS